ncbi:MGMT family protein, partial [Mesorhizobium sp. M7A.T.Ca.TU.009.01.3.1]
LSGYAWGAERKRALLEREAGESDSAYRSARR